MFKKLILAGMAIAAFAAFVLPATASASPVLKEGAETVAAGKTIIATNTNPTLFTGAFKVECSTAHLTATVTKNSGTKIEATVAVGGATFSGTGTSGDCTSALGSVHVTVLSELCLTSAAAPADEFSVTGCGEKPVEFTLNVTGGPESCVYKTVSVNGTYTTAATPATVNVSEQEAKKSAGGFFCPSSGKLDMDFDLYTDNLPTETALTIS